VALSAWPSGGDNLSPADDPFWDAAAELGMPVSIHLLLAAQQSKMGATNKGSVAIGASAFMYTMPILVEMIFQGVFDRFPKLRLALVEVGAGWIPHFLEMVDDRYWRNRHWTNTKVAKVPSQYFHDHCLATFIVDHNGVSVRHQVGISNMAWSTDFPHHGNDWPYSRRVIDSLFVNVPEDERRKIVCDNAARFWGLA
jgi:predicted TIM-barrel fold metal-dependent hydrolase